MTQRRSLLVPSPFLRFDRVIRYIAAKLADAVLSVRNCWASRVCDAVPRSSASQEAAVRQVTEAEVISCVRSASTPRAHVVRSLEVDARTHYAILLRKHTWHFALLDSLRHVASWNVHSASTLPTER